MSSRSANGNIVFMIRGLSSISLFATSLSILACGAGEPEPALSSGKNAACDAETKAVSVSVDAAEPEFNQEIPAHAPKLAANPDAAEDAKTFKEALAAGRAAVKEKKLPTAIEHFKRALAVDPNHSGVLGELGWAAFLLGDLATARASTGSALIYVRSPRRKGALLYNLGRVCESEGDSQRAMEHYRHSLTLRDNEIVKKRLAKLEAKQSEASEPGPEAQGAAGISDGSTESLCEQVARETWCGLEEGSCKCEFLKELKAPASNTSLRAAVVARAWGRVPAMGEVEGAQLFVETATGSWQAVDLVGDASSPGISYIHNSYELRSFEFAQVIEGGEAELVLTVQQTRTDGDYGENALEYERDLIEWLCLEDGGALTCMRFGLESAWGLDRMLEDGPDPAALAHMGEHGWAWAVDFTSEGVILSVSEGVENMPAALSGLLGTHTLSEFQKLGAVELIPLR